MSDISKTHSDQPFQFTSYRSVSHWSYYNWSLPSQLCKVMMVSLSYRWRQVCVYWRCIKSHSITSEPRVGPKKTLWVLNSDCCRTWDKFLFPLLLLECVLICVQVNWVVISLHGHGALVYNYVKWPWCRMWLAWCQWHQWWIQEGLGEMIKWNLPFVRKIIWTLEL